MYLFLYKFISHMQNNFGYIKTKCLCPSQLMEINLGVRTRA